MCKSQNRKEIKRACIAVMLMPHELHNWLLFMDLKAGNVSSRNRPIGLCQKETGKSFSIRQAFPQDGRLGFCVVGKLEDLGCARGAVRVLSEKKDPPRAPPPAHRKGQNFGLFFKK